MLSFHGNSGPTASWDTGPSRDHTKGTSAGSYVYIEASGKQPGEKARLLSPVYAPTTKGITRAVVPKVSLETSKETRGNYAAPLRLQVYKF